MKFKKNFFTKLIFLLKNQAGFFKPSSENKYLLFLFHHLERKYIYVECREIKLQKKLKSL